MLQVHIAENAFVGTKFTSVLLFVHGKLSNLSGNEENSFMFTYFNN